MLMIKAIAFVSGNRRSCHPAFGLGGTGHNSGHRLLFHVAGQLPGSSHEKAPPVRAGLSNRVILGCGGPREGHRQLIRLTKPRKKNPPGMPRLFAGFFTHYSRRGFGVRSAIVQIIIGGWLRNFVRLPGMNRRGLSPSDFFRLGVELLAQRLGLKLRLKDGKRHERA